MTGYELTIVYAMKPALTKLVCILGVQAIKAVARFLGQTGADTTAGKIASEIVCSSGIDIVKDLARPDFTARMRGQALQQTFNIFQQIV